VFYGLAAASSLLETPSFTIVQRASFWQRRPSGEVLRRVEPSLYYVLAGTAVLLVARAFYASLKLQIFYSSVRGDPYLGARDWSAPLDDVFIHFDFARSIARGRPFEWSTGNGYSSGGTSLLYPFALAPGFALGFRGLLIMQFAAIVAATSVFATLIGCRRLFHGMPRWAKYLAPPALLSMGALDWSLFSGMEVAFFLAVWALALVFWDDLVALGSRGATRSSFGVAAGLLGFANVLLVATRPEAIVVAFVFGVSGAHALRPKCGLRAAAQILGISVVPAMLVLVASAVANRVLTGDWSAAGALVKLEAYDPRLSARDVFDAWVFHVRYQVGRVTGYHVANGLLFGSLFWVLPVLSLAFAKTRRVAVVLWAQAVLWVLIVALNGQVRWQNERYTMPALAWMLLAAALGVAAVFEHDFRSARSVRAARYGARVAVLALVSLLAFEQVPRMRDQLWFFGRASRNIRDQHVKVGRKIRHELPQARRVLVGDAGAIPYESDLPALDIIGLGGYRGLPFARASRWGVAAALELVERMPPSARPDVMAIYPSWWGELPSWFGRALDGVSVRGNVICGGLTAMIYASDFSAMGRSGAPAFPIADGERLVDEVDFADVISEKEHRYRIDGALGFADMKLLGNPARPREDLWDAGRVVPPPASVASTLAGFDQARSARLIVRLAPPEPATLALSIDDVAAGKIAVRPSDAWQEVSFDVPAERLKGTMRAALAVSGSELVLYHLWGVERR